MVLAWFALIGFLSPFLCGGLMYLNKEEDGSPKIIQGSVSAKALSLLSIFGAFCCLVMILKGIHIWENWEIPSIDPNVAARTSTRARGKGGIILLAIKFFPQFLVFGYGIWGWQLKPYLKRAKWLWG